MDLNDKEIADRAASEHLLSDHTSDNIRNCTYILRIGTVFRPESGDEELLTSEKGRQKYWLVRRNRGWNRVRAACQVSDRGRVREIGRAHV